MVPGFRTELQPTATLSPRIAPSFRFPVARRSPFAGRDLDLPSVVAEVGEDDAGTEVDVVAEDRVADVVEMRGVGAREEDGALHLDVRADDATVTHPAAAAQVGPDADLDVFADPHRPFDDGARRDARALAENDPIADEVRARMHSPADLGRRQRREECLERRVEERPGPGALEARGEDCR